METIDLVETPPNLRPDGIEFEGLCGGPRLAKMQ
jgi:hypothetical protein